MTNNRQFKGYHLAIIMLCFFGVIMTVNFSMAYIATSHWTGLVVKNSYVASQLFNDELKAAKRQKELGWSSHFTYRLGNLTVGMKNAKGAPLHATSVKAKIGRPAFEALDHQVEFSSFSKGLFQVENHLEPGLWHVVLSADIDGAPYRRDIRLYVGEDGRGVIQ